MVKYGKLKSVSFPPMSAIAFASFEDRNTDINCLNACA